MPSALAEITAEVTERLVALADHDAELRSQLRRFALALLELTETPSPAPSESIPTSTEAAEPAEERLEPRETPARPSASEKPSSAPLPELTLGRTAPSPPAPIVAPAEKMPAEDLGLIESRCRLKAEACRWAATRRRMMTEGANFYTEIDPVDRDIIARAKELPNCFLWMSHSSGPTPSNPAYYEVVAGCFEAAAEAIALIRFIQEEPEANQADFETALDLLAESQSALRVAVDQIDGPVDRDQNEIFQWLRTTATEQQIFIQNYMRLDNPADPSLWSSILSRIEEASHAVQEAKRRRGQEKRLLGKVRHKTTLIARDPDRAAAEWDTLISAVCELVAGGLPPSNRELRELLLPVIDAIPDKEDAPKDFNRVLVEIDRYLATIPPPETPVVVMPTREVSEVAELLRGKSLVLIGGDKRQGAYQSLKSAFGLRELTWIDTRAHESIEGFAPYVARPDVAAVLLAIRWSSHSYGEVKTFCDQNDKPLVRLPAGYNPNQVAAQILAQASDRLR